MTLAQLQRLFGVIAIKNFKNLGILTDVNAFFEYTCYRIKIHIKLSSCN